MVRGTRTNFSNCSPTLRGLQASSFTAGSWVRIVGPGCRSLRDAHGVLSRRSSRGALYSILLPGFFEESPYPSDNPPRETGSFGLDGQWWEFRQLTSLPNGRAPTITSETTIPKPLRNTWHPWRIARAPYIKPRAPPVCALVGPKDLLATMAQSSKPDIHIRGGVSLWNDCLRGRESPSQQGDRSRGLSNNIWGSPRSVG